MTRKTRKAIIPAVSGVPLRLPPKRRLPTVDVEAELGRNNVLIAEQFILSGLINGSLEERRQILALTSVRYFEEKLLQQFLYASISEYLSSNLAAKITPRWLLPKIKNFHLEVWNARPKAREVRAALLTCGMIFNLSLSFEQVRRAIALREMVARDEGLI